MELNKLTLTEAMDGLSEYKFTGRDLVSACLSRIKEVEPKINAFITVTAEAANKEASEIQEKPGDIKPFLGVPAAIKDNFNTKGLKTTAASNIIRDYVAPYDATVVHKIKESGAVIIGKTNMDAFAHGSSTETSDFGPTKNPWNTDYLPGGSSGGSAAAVAADETIFAIGSETAGSIRQPAAWCGVVGLKPTYGRVSRYGLIAMASSTDSPGPITKTVADARTVYRVIAGFDLFDATSADRPVSDSGNLKKIAGLKIGLPKEYFRTEAQPGVNETVMAAAKKLESLGARVLEVSLFDPKYAISVYTILQRSEVSSNLARFDGIRFGGTRDQFNEENKRRIMLGTYTLQSGYYEAYYQKAQKIRTIIIEDFNRVFEKVDLLLSPVSPTTAQKVGASANQAMFGEISDILIEPSSIAGLPGISVPCGFVKGLPVGMQLVGPMWSENLILDTAQEYEQATEWHKQKPNL